MKRTLICIVLLLTIASCSTQKITRPMGLTVSPTNSIPVKSTETIEEEEQAIEEQLLAPVPTSKFSNGAPVRTPIGCQEGMIRGVDC